MGKFFEIIKKNFVKAVKKNLIFSSKVEIYKIAKCWDKIKDKTSFVEIEVLDYTYSAPDYDNRKIYRVYDAKIENDKVILKADGPYSTSNDEADKIKVIDRISDLPTLKFEKNKKLVVKMSKWAWEVIKECD